MLTWLVTSYLDWSEPREGNWQLHLFAIRKMIPWCFAYDRLNYARYKPTYYAQLINIQTDHPRIFQHFFQWTILCPGCWWQSNWSHSCRPSHINHCQQRHPNSRRNDNVQTEKWSAVKRYNMTAEHRCAFLGQLRNMTQVKQPAFPHSELQKPQIDR